MTLEFKTCNALSGPCPPQVQSELFALWEEMAKHVRLKQQLENYYLRPFAGTLFEGGETMMWDWPSEDDEYHSGHHRQIPLLIDVCKLQAEHIPTIRAIGICYPTVFPQPFREAVTANLEHVEGYLLNRCLPNDCSYEGVSIYRYFPLGDFERGNGHEFFGVPVVDAFPPCA